MLTGMPKQSEADLCAAFRAWLTARGWAVHAEVADWDLVAVGTAAQAGAVFYTGGHRHDGLLVPGLPVEPPAPVTVGIQAKLVASVEVLYQASQRSGPLLRCAVVPWASYEFLRVAALLHVAVAVQHTGGKKRYLRAAPEGFAVQATKQHYPQATPFWLPPVVQDIPAGVPSPAGRLTQWRLKALRVCAVGRARGHLTTADFQAAGVSHARWVEAGWMRQLPGKEGRRARYALTAAAPDAGFEAVWAQIVAAEQPATKEPS